MPLSWMRNGLVLSLLFIIFALQLCFEPIEIYKYEAQIGLFVFLSFLALCLLYPKNIFETINAHSRSSRYLLVFFISYLIIVTFQIVWSYVNADPLLIDNLYKVFRKYFKLIYLLMVYYFIYLSIKIARNKPIIIGILVTSMIAVSIYGLILYLGEETYHLKISVKESSKNLTGFYLQGTLFLCLYLVYVSKKYYKPFLIMGCLYSFVSMIISNNRGAVVSTILGYSIALLMAGKTRKFFVFSFILLISVIFLLFVYPEMGTRYGAIFILDDRYLGTGYGSTYLRIHFMKTTILNLHFFSGSGFGLGDIYLSRFIPIWIYEILEKGGGDVLSAPHNSYLFIALENGILVAGFLAFLLIKSILKFRPILLEAKNEKIVLMAGVISVFFRTMVGEFLYYESTWFFLAIFYALLSKEKESVNYSYPSPSEYYRLKPKGLI